MCNEAARRTALGLMRDDFRQVRIELTFPEGLPNLGEAPSIRITDSTVIVRAAGDAVEMVQRRWSWVGRTRKPVYNYRSEGRRFGNSASSRVAAEGGSGQGRCLIPLDGFYEFTDGEPGAKRKDKWLFTLAEHEDRSLGSSASGGEARAAPGLFCVAALWKGRADPIAPVPAGTLTVAPARGA